MNTYEVEIREVLVRKIVIPAESKSHAESIIKNLYWDRQIKLNADDCIESKVQCTASDEKEMNQPELWEEEK